MSGRLLSLSFSLVSGQRLPSTGGWCWVNQDSLHMWTWLWCSQELHRELWVHFGIHLSVPPGFSGVTCQGGGQMPLTLPPHIQRGAQDCRFLAALTQSAPGLNSITQEGTLKNPHLWLMLWFCGLKRQRRRKELLGAITMEPLYCLARALNDNGKPHYWLADS